MIQLTGTETVKDALLLFIKSHINNDEISQSILENFITEHKDSFRGILDRLAKDKFGYVQLGSMFLQSRIIEALKSRA